MIYVAVGSLCKNISKIMSEVLFYQLFMCAATSAFNIFALEANEIVGVQAATNLYLLSTVLAATFIYCYLSERLTTNLLDIGENFYKSNWYLLPTELKFLLIYPIQSTQREFRLKCIGLFDCSLSVFGVVSSFFPFFLNYFVCGFLFFKPSVEFFICF